MRAGTKREWCGWQHLPAQYSQTILSVGEGGTAHHHFVSLHCWGPGSELESSRGPKSRGEQTGTGRSSGMGAASIGEGLHFQGDTSGDLNPGMSPRGPAADAALLGAQH